VFFFFYLRVYNTTDPKRPVEWEYMPGGKEELQSERRAKRRGARTADAEESQAAAAFIHMRLRVACGIA